MVAARVFHINLLLICVTMKCGQFLALQVTTDLCQQQHVISCWVVNVNDTPNYSIKKILTLLDFRSLDDTVCYTVCNLGMSGTFSLRNSVFSSVSMFKAFFNLTET